jgi:hypothetical protein
MTTALKSLTVAGIQVIETDGKVAWAKFKNTPATIVSASGHDHNAVHYLSTQTDSMFNTVNSTLESIRVQIEAVGIKTTAYIGGGASNGSSVCKYDKTTQTTSNLGGLLSHSPNNSPSISSKIRGYMTNTNQTVTKFTHSTQSAANTNSCPIGMGGSLVDHAVQSRGYITNGSGSWATIDTTTDIWETRTSATSTSAGRPMLSSYTYGLTKATGTNTSYKYTYSTSTSAATISFAVTGTPAGLNRNSTYGYWIANTDSNIKHSYVSDSVIQLPLFTINFSNANMLACEFDGYSISGSSQTNVQKITWATEVVAAAGSCSVDLTGGSGIEA